MSFKRPMRSALGKSVSLPDSSGSTLEPASTGVAALPILCFDVTPIIGAALVRIDATKQNAKLVLPFGGSNKAYPR